MDRSTAMQLLKQHRPTLADRFGVVRLALFGSTARDTVSSIVATDVPSLRAQLALILEAPPAR